MLDHITIKNFRCLRDVSVPLKPLTVLIGENDTGKSTFLEAVHFRGGSTETRFLPLDHWQGRSVDEPFIHFETPGEFPFIVTPQGRGTGRDAAVKIIEASPDGGLPSHKKINLLNTAPAHIGFSGQQLTSAAMSPALDSLGCNVPGILVS